MRLDLDRLGKRSGCDETSMKLIFLIPLLAGALLFSGCEATVVESRPYGRSHYADRGYYARDRNDYYHSRSDYYSGRRNYGYVETRPVYATPYRSRASYYGRTREINRFAVVTPRAHVQRTVIKEVPSRHHKKKKDDHDHR